MKLHPPVADELIGRTLASDVLHRLRADIVEARLEPGQRLRFESLRSSYGVSFSTLREALAHLVQESLVVAEGQRGFRVAPVSRRELQDVIYSRIFIETELLARSVACGGPEWDAELQRLYDALEEGPVHNPAQRRDPAWQVRHLAFHEGLVAAADSPTLLAMRALLSQRAARYRAWARRLNPDMPSEYGTHRPLLEAALARDAKTLIEGVSAQFRITQEIILQEAGTALVNG
ncbi:GntR family transcriptional regulator [Siccirubricoccus phaeus]|uniref:GntR family transcriptional regulator n=1 Tax=Siccirubricoccus phaeus TaxID=2595053 RepID=UPI00165B7049|nr:GntR family transcriptional regulator [Siccirubricoccus phaeus]